MRMSSEALPPICHNPASMRASGPVVMHAAAARPSSWAPVKEVPSTVPRYQVLQSATTATITAVGICLTIAIRDLPGEGFPMRS